jgi:GT2 family glycosyltransferase
MIQGENSPLGVYDQMTEPDGVVPDVSVIIVNYNTKELLRQALSALYQNNSGIHLEVIVFDNASTDDSLAMLQDDFPAIQMIRSSLNLGFAKANNLAIEKTYGRYILLLNPDTIIQNNAIRIAKEFMDKHPEVGICGPKVVLPNGKLDSPCRRSFKTPAIYFFKALGLTALFPKSRCFGKYYLSYLDENQITEVDSVIGAFLMIRRRTLEEIGLLDEGFYMYAEEEDWCFRAKKAGWKVIYNPEATIVHYKAASARQQRGLTIYYWHRSALRFHRKNLAPLYLPIVNWTIYAGIMASLVAKLVLYFLSSRSIFFRRALFKILST